MRKIHLVLVLAASLLVQPIFADDANMPSGSKPCGKVAKACLEGGYDVRSEKAGKKFWQDCMKPAILGKSVEGVKMDADVVKACRSDKISEMKKELKELEKVS